MEYDKNNVFAKILRGELPNKTVYEDEYVLAFHNIYPQSDIHILVIPKGEYRTFIDFCLNAKNDEKDAFFTAVAKIAKEKEIEESCQLLANCGEKGSQEIPHFHMHITSGNALKFQ